jgi:hypothetical protein
MGSHALRTRSRRNLLIALVAAIMLIGATGVYSAHGFGDRDHDNGHCDLCVHFSGTAGSPGHAVVVGKPVLVVRIPLTPPTLILSHRRESGAHLPRGPPSSSQTA